MAGALCGRRVDGDDSGADAGEGQQVGVKSKFCRETGG